jgi:hypothetical protein
VSVNYSVNTREFFLEKNIRTKTFNSGETRVVSILKCIKSTHHFAVRHDSLMRNTRFGFKFILYVNFHLIFLLDLLRVLDERKIRPALLGRDVYFCANY